MSENKLTDNEIIKALEHIEAFTCCQDCAFYKKCKGKCAVTAALALINHLQAENSNLTSDLTSLQNNLTSLKEENERLKGIKTNDWLVKGLSKEQLEKEKAEALIDNAKKCAKAEAYKECIEKAKDLFPKEDWFTREAFDNLLKELEDNNNA